MEYLSNTTVSAKQIADLRQSVGWNRMESCYKNPLMTSYFHIACYVRSHTPYLLDLFVNKPVVRPLHMTEYNNMEFVLEDIDGRWIAFGMKQK